jgi:hypothetical protein
MTPGPKTFVGFRGIAAKVQIGSIQFWILAKNTRQLDALWQRIVPGIDTFDPARCKPAILIESAVLPDPKVGSVTPCAPSDSSLSSPASLSSLSPSQNRP